MSKALETQVGGNHYKDMPMQPVELFAKTHCTAFQANIWKYIARYKYKNGAEDIRKCKHYAELAIELKCNGNLGYKKTGLVNTFCTTNSTFLSAAQRRIILHTGWDNYQSVIKECDRLLQIEYPEES